MEKIYSQRANQGSRCQESISKLFFSVKNCIHYLELIKMNQPFFQEVSVYHCV